MSEPSMFSSCEHCVFATYNEEQNEQTGCQVKRLDKFKAQGSEVKLVDEHYDGITDTLVPCERKHFIIKDRICLMCCPIEKTIKMKMTNPRIDMRNAIGLKCEAYILVSNNNTLEQTKATVDSLNMQILKPTVINVVLNTDYVSRPKLVKYFNLLEESFHERGLEYTWNVTFISDKSENGERNSTDWALDHAVATCKSPFYCVFLAGQIAPKEYLDSIDKSLNDDLQRFCVLLPADDDWQGAFVQTMLHKKLHGNMPETLECYDDGELVATCLFGKVQYIADKTGRPYMIRKVTEICPTMK